MQTRNSFKKLVKDIQSEYTATCVGKNSLIVNEVNSDITVNTDKVMLTYLLSNMMNTLISKTKHSCLRISAKKYSDVVLVHFKDKGLKNFTLNSPSGQKLQSFAQSLGGSIYLNDYRDNITTVTLSFTNTPVPAVLN